MESCQTFSHIRLKAGWGPNGTYNQNCILYLISLCIKIFDVLYQQGPIQEVYVHDGSINCMASHDTGSLICLGKDNGTVALMELSDGFVTSPNMRVNIELSKLG